MPDFLGRRGHARTTTARTQSFRGGIDRPVGFAPGYPDMCLNGVIEKETLARDSGRTHGTAFVETLPLMGGSA